MMNKNNSVLIKINNFTDIRKFADIITTFVSDVNVYYTNDKYYDAKSILAIIALDISQPRYIEILSDDSKEIAKFKEAMEAFKYSE